jgi:ABC-type transporter Mla MlaB component
MGDAVADPSGPPPEEVYPLSITSTSSPALVVASTLRGVISLEIRSTMLDFSRRDRFLSEATPFLEEGHPLEIDLSQVQYLDHFGFEALLGLVQQATAPVRFKNACQGVHSLFILAHLSHLVIEESR